MSLDDLYRPELVAISESFTGNVNEDMERVKEDPVVLKALKDCAFSIFIDSGARGTWDQARQMVLARLYVADASNSVRPYLIRSSLVQGLKPREFFESCWGSRKGLLDTAMSTGDSGYLTRQLIYSTAVIELDESETGKDCGTTDGLNITIESKDMIKSLLGRYYTNKDGHKKLIKLSDTGSLIGRTINLRSPVYCKNKRICKTCYGNLHKILHSPQIGIVATQAVGERTTQLVLRTFHLSGAAQGNIAGQNQDIISGMSIVKKLFHTPAKVLGNIQDPLLLVRTIFDIFNQYGDIHMIHFEVIVAGMMWNDSTPWRLIPNRDTIVPEYVSILQVPARASWLLGTAFSNVKQKLLNGLLADTDDVESAITTLFRY